MMTHTDRAELKRLISEHRLALLRQPGRCLWCFGPFEHPNPQKRYCTRRCRELAYLNRRRVAA